MSDDDQIRSGGPPEAGFVLLHDEPAETRPPDDDKELGDMAEVLRQQEDDGADADLEAREAETQRR